MKSLQQTNTSRSRATARQALQHFRKVLENTPGSEDLHVTVDRTNELICLPRSVADLLCEILSKTAAGQTVGIIPTNAELTTQQAADLLNVSRPHIVKLIDEGTLKGYKVGKHRRLNAIDVQKYKHQRDVEQRDAADELTALSDELGLYE